MARLLHTRASRLVATRLSAYLVAAVSLGAGALVLADPGNEASADAGGEPAVTRAEVADCLRRLRLDVGEDGPAVLAVQLRGGLLRLRVHASQQAAVRAVGARTVALPNGPRGLVPVDNNVSWTQEGAVAMEQHAQLSPCFHAAPGAAWRAPAAVAP